MRTVLAIVAALSAFSAYGGEDAKGCRDPTYANRLAGCAIDNCLFKIYDELPMLVQSDPERRSEQVGGERQHVEYTCPETTSAVEITRNYESALKKAGFRMVWHGEDSLVRFTAKLEKDGKTVWTMLRIANGVQPFIDFVAVKPVPSRIQGAQAGPPPGQKDSEGCVDSPVIGRMAGGSINTCSHKAFDEAKFRISDDGETKIEGEVYDNEFSNDIQTSAYEIQRAYEVAFKKLGYRIVYRSSESPEHLTAEFKKGDQETWVGIHNYNDNGNYRMVTVQTKAMAQQIEVNAASLLEDLRQNGHVAVYGINFDFGKATITDDSVKVLDEIGKLLKDNADLKLRIEGHTDNVGKAHANFELSRKRATSVKGWLTHHGIDGSRLTIDGFGDTRPIEDNKTDEGRARNRRVELVKL